jgi:transposase-like protein
MTSTKQEVMEVLTGPERRRRWSSDEKLAMVRESLEPGKSVSMVARQHGVNPNQLFHWRKLHQNGKRLLRTVLREIDDGAMICSAPLGSGVQSASLAAQFQGRKSSTRFTG